MLSMSPKGQRERERWASRTGRGSRKAPSNRPIEDLVVKVIMSELDPFKQTKSRVTYALPIGLEEGQVTCTLPIGFLWQLSPSPSYQDSLRQSRRLLPGSCPWGL